MLSAQQPQKILSRFVQSIGCNVNSNFNLYAFRKSQISCARSKPSINLSIAYCHCLSRSGSIRNTVEYPKLYSFAGRPVVAMSSKAEVKVLHDLHCELGEAPTWDDRTQRLFFVDINKKKIYSSNADGSDLFSIDTHETVGTIALTTDEDLLLAAMARSVFPVTISTRKVGEAIATVPEDHGIDQMRFNDGKSSPGGVFLVGRMHLDFASGKPGRFYRLHWTSKARGHFEQLKGEDEIGLPNGLAWDEENLYHVDTVHQSISAYKTDSDGVPIRDDPNKPIQGKVVVKTDKKDGFGPDGMCISKQGNLWTALPGGSKIKAYSKKTGEPVNEVKLPVTMPTAPTFGGPNLETMFVTSLGENDDSEHSGAVFAVKVPGESGYGPAYKVKVPDS